METYSGILRVVAFELPPFTIRVLRGNNQGEIVKGVAFRTLDTILNVLDIKYSIQFINDNSGIQMTNGSWTGALGTLQRNESDIVMTVVIPSPIRETAVDFSIGVHYSASFIFGGTPPQEMPDIGAIIKTFDETVWSITIACMIMLVFLSGVKVLSAHDDGAIVSVNKKELYRLFSAYSAALFMEGTPRDPVTSRGRFLFAIWWLVMLVLANGFCGHSRAMMMIPREGLRVRDLDHLASLLHVVKPITARGGFYETFFRTGSDNNRKIYQAMALGDGVGGMFSPEHLLMLKEGKAVTLHDSIVIMRALGNKCKQLRMDNIYYSGPFYVADGCWPIRKGLDMRLQNKINNRIRRLHEGYIIRKWTEDETRSFDQCLAGGAESVTEKPLSLKDMKTLFVLLCGCLFSSFLFFLAELVAFYGFKM